MKTPTWNDVENARDLHTGPQRDIPQPEAKFTDHVVAVLNRDMTDNDTFAKARVQYRNLNQQHDALLAALKAILPAYQDCRMALVGHDRDKANPVIEQARAAIRQCEEGK